MKLLLLLFCVGFASATFHEDALSQAIGEVTEEVLSGNDELAKDALLYYDDNGSKDDVVQKLKDAYVRLLEKVKDALEHGKTVNAEVLEKIKELRKKLEDRKIEISERVKEIAQKIKDKAREFLEKLLEKLEDKEQTYYSEDGDGEDSDLAQKLRDTYARLLERFRDRIEQGKEIGADLLEKLKDVRQKMKDHRVEAGNKIKEIIANIKDKAREVLQKFLDKLEGKTYYSDTDDVLGQKLRESLENLLKRVKDAIDQGKEIKEDILEKIKDVRQKMKDRKVEAGEKIKELVQNIREKVKDAFQKLLEKLGIKGDQTYYAASEDVSEEVKDRLRKAYEDLLEKIKDSVERGKVVKEEVLEKLKEVRDKMKEARVGAGEKAKELFNKIKDKASDFLKKILEKLGNFGDGESRSDVPQETEAIRNIFKKLKEYVLSKVDKEALKNKIEELFGKGSEMADQLLALLKEKGEKHKNKLIDLIDRILGEEEEKEERRSIQELWEKVKNYFQDLKIDLKEKFLKFGEWAKETMRDRLDKTKSKLDNIKAIAKEFVTHTKDLSKEVAVEGLEFLRPYKEDLGDLWNQVKDSVKEILGKKE